MIVKSMCPFDWIVECLDISLRGLVSETAKQAMKDINIKTVFYESPRGFVGGSQEWSSHASSSMYSLLPGLAL